MQKLTPLGDNVLVIPDPITEINGSKVKLAEDGKTYLTLSGLSLPEGWADMPRTGTVAAVGKGAISETGQRLPIDTKEGDKVLYYKFSGNEYTINKQKFVIFRASDILATIEQL